MVKKKKSFAVDPAFFGGAYISFYITYNMYQILLGTSLRLSVSLFLSVYLFIPGSLLLLLLRMQLSTIKYSTNTTRRKIFIPACSENWRLDLLRKISPWRPLSPSNLYHPI